VQLIEVTTTNTVLSPSICLVFLFSHMDKIACASIDPINNPLCGRCAPGYAVDGNQCIADCTKANGGRVFGLLVLAFFLLCIFHKTTRSGSPDTKILFYYVQMILLFLGSDAKAWIAWLSFIDFNITQAGGGTCVIPFTAAQYVVS
jgi:hypothetical protein